MTIRKIVIAGAGTMGYSMAQVFARYHFDVTLYNHGLPTLQRAKMKIRENTETMVESGALTREDADALYAGLSFTTDTACFSDCDLVIENIIEDAEIKLAFYREISPLTKDSTIISTNTSGLSINLLSKGVKKPERFLGFHWLNPPHLVPLIEIIRGDATTDEAVETVREVALAIEKKPAVIKKDVPGFAVNRLQFALVREALSMVEQGVIEPEDLDSVLKYGLGFRWSTLGPLETMDLGGLDVFYKVGSYLFKDLDDSKEVSPLLKEHFEKGEFGVKSGKGFYDYSDGRGEEVTRERDEKMLSMLQALF